MADLICIDGLKTKRALEERAKIVEGLEQLLTRAKAGELLGVAFVALPMDRECLSVGMLKTAECGTYELVGASVMMSDYFRNRLGNVP